MKKDLKIIVYIYGYLEFNKAIQTKEHFMTDKYGLQIWKRKEKLTLLQNHSQSTMNSNPLYVIVNLLCCGPLGICSGLDQPQKIKEFTTLVFYQHY